jgi:hypothetical protein
MYGRPDLRIYDVTWRRGPGAHRGPARAVQMACVCYRPGNRSISQPCSRDFRGWAQMRVKVRSVEQLGHGGGRRPPPPAPGGHRSWVRRQLQPFANPCNGGGRDHRFGFVRPHFGYRGRNRAGPVPIRVTVRCHLHGA